MTGTYAAVQFSDDTVTTILEYLREFKIPAAVKGHRLHSTLLYSRAACPNYTAPGKYKKPLFGYPLQFHKWEVDGIVGAGKQQALVLEFRCPALVARHNALMKEHNATWDYGEYIPHITLSYDIKELNISTLPPIDKYLSELEIVDEYDEELA